MRQKIAEVRDDIDDIDDIMKDFISKFLSKVEVKKYLKTDANRFP